MTKLTSSFLVAPLCLLAIASSACQQNGDDDGEGGASSSADTTGASGTEASGTGGAGGGTGSGGAPGTGGSGSTTTSTGAGAGEPGEPGWTIMPLLDDETGENGTVFRAGNDLVTGIHFASIDDGIITTTGDNQSFANGGAIYSATQKVVNELLFSGNRDGLCLLGTINFLGLERSPDGYYALAHACDTIASHDGGATFDIASNGVEQFGIERVLAIRHRADEVLAVHDTYVTTTTADAPGPNAQWDDVWAPQAVPPTPDPVPEGQCQEGPRGMTPFQRTRAYVSPDGGRLAYTALQDDQAVICVSDDAGRSFFPKSIPDLGEDAATFLPDGVVFASDDVGIAWWANYIYPGQQWIARTTDGGQTWAQVEVPADVADIGLELRSAFFAPDGQHGWLVGSDRDDGLALILKTSDGGATWERSGGDLAAKVSEAGGMKLHTGFALDASHIWVGGEDGVLLANEAGGE